MRKLFFLLLIFVIVYFVYRFIYPNPRNWYDHYLYLARAITHGRVNLTDLPSFYQDIIVIKNKTYVPFPIGPAVLLIPFMVIYKNVTQQQVSLLVGAFDAGLVFYLLRKFTSTLRAFLLAIFCAFGTAVFWASVVGTTWYFAHVCAFLFLGLSLVFHFEKKDIFSGICFSLAVLCRYPVLFGILFFVLQLRRERERLIKFLVAAASLSPLHFLYSYLRFGSFFRTGYLDVYKDYLRSNYPYTILKLIDPKLPIFGYLDIRNIPLHLFTFLLEPPVITPNLNISPSPYGMGIIFTSPLLFLAFVFPFKRSLERNLFLSACSVAAVDFLHYMQGWVQFGYRFVIDFLPFLLIILAFRFRATKLQVILIVISILVNFWGVRFAISAGW